MYISIIIPLYNGIEFLETAISSIKNQTYKNWEVIIGINGHYHDSDTYKIAVTFMEPNIHIKLYDTIGKEDTCNRMIYDCKYDIICLLDVDDYWEPTKLEKQIDIWKFNKYDVIGTHCNYFGDIFGSPKIPTDEIIPSTVFQVNPLINSSIMIHKNNAIWYKNFKGLDDYDMWLRLTFEGKRFFNIPEKLTWHRSHKSSSFNNSNYLEVPKLQSYWKIMMNNLITIVTCYYNIKSKFPSSKYYEWMINFLSIPCNLVIFTDEQSASIIKNIRNMYNLHEKTHIIIKPIEKWYTYKYYEYFKYCNLIDVEKNHHTPELYMLWNEKTFFVKDVISINPFNSFWFFWSDIGCVRNRFILPFIKTFPNPYKIIDYDVNKMVLLTIEPFIECDYNINNNNIPIIFNNQDSNTSCKNIHRIQGGFFGGHINCWNNWINNYNLILENFINNKIFSGKDQYIMSTIYILNNTQINLINAKNIEYVNAWFYFLFHFA